ncbi:13435_t:CDS:2 [Ambispora leptoticha]|uniref:13435_t:CDS:1 n=1 Tax=Ambispora leptoticha TaxID=144679 RepID=A0A9N9EXY7_9GLOM|nr:13435_t:CDS:2 [Ambispora leptoticha]
MASNSKKKSGNDRNEFTIEVVSDDTIQPAVVEKTSIHPVDHRRPYYGPRKGYVNDQKRNFDSVEGEVIKIETSQNGKCAITLKKETDSKIYIGHHCIETSMGTDLSETDSLKDAVHDDLGHFELDVKSTCNWSVAVFDAKDNDKDICWIAFSFYDFSSNGNESKQDNKLGNYRFDSIDYPLFIKIVFFLTYNRKTKSVRAKKIVKHHKMKLTPLLDDKHPEKNYLKTYFKLEYENDKEKIDDIEFSVKENRVFYTNKKKCLIRLFYQSPDQQDNEHAKNDENNPKQSKNDENNKGWRLEDGNEKAILIYGNEEEREIKGKAVKISIIKEKIIIEGEEINIGEKKIKENEYTLYGEKENINTIIITGDKIVRIYKSDEKGNYSLVNIWSIPIAFSKYFEDPIIADREFDEKNQSVKIKLKSRNGKDKEKILEFEHDIKFKPHDTSIVGMCTILKSMMHQQESYRKNQDSQRKFIDLTNFSHGQKKDNDATNEWEVYDALFQTTESKLKEIENKLDKMAKQDQAATPAELSARLTSLEEKLDAILEKIK